MRADKVFQNGTIVTAVNRFAGDIDVKDGRILFVGKTGSGFEADEVVQMDGKFVLRLQTRL